MFGGGTIVDNQKSDFEKRPHGVQTVPHGHDAEALKIDSTWGQIGPRLGGEAGRGYRQMKHFHLPGR